MTHFRIEATGQDGIISAISLGGADYISKHIIQGIPDEDDKLYGSDAVSYTHLTLPTILGV